jgi:hypothetical protein
MTADQQRIVAALEKIDGLRDIHITPYGEVAWLSNNDGHHWLAKTWEDFCRVLGSQAEIGMLQLNRYP